MPPLARVLLRALCGAAATTAAVSVLSARYTRHPAAALNAISHIVWGRRAFRVDRADVSHTLVGMLLNGSAMVSWSLVYQLLPKPRSRIARAVKAAGVSALAYATDYHVVPERLTPGFEERLPATALAIVYAALGLGLFAIPDAMPDAHSGMGRPRPAAR